MGYEIGLYKLSFESIWLYYNTIFQISTFDKSRKFIQIYIINAKDESPFGLRGLNNFVIPQTLTKLGCHNQYIMFTGAATNRERLFIGASTVVI